MTGRGCANVYEQLERNSLNPFTKFAGGIQGGERYIMQQTAPPAPPSPAVGAAPESLKSERDRFVALAFCWADFLLEVDLDETIVFAGGPWKGLTGLSADALKGRKMTDIVHAGDVEFLQSLLGVSRPPGRIQHVDIPFPGERSTPLPTSLSGSFLQDLCHPFFFSFRFFPFPPPPPPFFPFLPLVFVFLPSLPFFFFFFFFFPFSFLFPFPPPPLSLIDSRAKHLSAWLSDLLRHCVCFPSSLSFFFFLSLPPSHPLFLYPSLLLPLPLPFPPPSFYCLSFSLRLPRLP
mgnify:CR=1 FL=1